MNAQLRRWRATRDLERGSALIPALVFMIITALIVSFVLARVSANLKFSSLVQGRTDRRYAADAGVEQAMQLLTVDPTRCLKETVENLPSQSLNGRTATVTCRAVDTGDIPQGSDGWAAVVLRNLSKQSGGAVTLRGPVYVRGTITGSGGPLIDEGGSVYQYSSNCPGSLRVPSESLLIVRPTPPYRWRCTTAAPPTIAAVLPPVPSVTDPIPVTDGQCRVFFPGRYTDEPDLLDRNYFVSGTYYFEDIGEWEINGDVVGGYNPDDPTPLAPCVADRAATDATPGGNGGGYGVQWVMGGSSRLGVDNGKKVVLHTRVPGPDEPGATPGISFRTVITTANGYKATSLSQPVMEAEGGQPEFSSFGLVYSPNADVELVGPVGDSVLNNGVVARDLVLKLSNANDATTVIGLGTPTSGRRVIEITARATSPGTADVVSRAVVEIREATRPPTVVVESWRTTVGAGS